MHGSAKLKKTLLINFGNGYGNKAGVTKQEFDDYFDGADQAIAIHVHKAKVLVRQLGLVRFGRFLAFTLHKVFDTCKKLIGP